MTLILKVNVNFMQMYHGYNEAVSLSHSKVPTSRKERRFRGLPVQSVRSFHQVVFRQRAYIHSMH